MSQASFDLLQSLSQADVGAAGSQRSKPAKHSSSAGKKGKGQAKALVTPTRPPPVVAFEFQDFSEDLVSILRSDCIKLSRLSKDTFWLDLHATPRCLLESLALRVLGFHVARLGINESEEVVGGEWWVQVKDELDETSLHASTPSSSSSSLSSHVASHSDYDPNSGIDLHYDKDEELAGYFGIGKFPRLSTVTYLSSSDRSHPTIVFDNKIDTPVGHPIKNCWVSQAVVGKHIGFDGSLLHGAPTRRQGCENAVAPTELEEDTVPAALREPVAQSIHEGTCGKFRITFLVNVWTDHRPLLVQPLAEELVSSLAGSDSETFDTACSSAESVFTFPRDAGAAGWDCSSLSLRPAGVGEQIVTEEMAEDDSAGAWEDLPFVSSKAVWGKDEDESGLTLTYWRPATWQLSTGASTVHVRYSTDEISAFLHNEDEEDEEEADESDGIKANA